MAFVVLDFHSYNMEREFERLLLVYNLRSDEQQQKVNTVLNVLSERLQTYFSIDLLFVQIRLKIRFTIIFPSR